MLAPPRAHHPVPLYVLDVALEVGEGVGGIVGDLRDDVLLAAGKKGDIMALLHQLSGEVEADESRAA